MKVQPEMKIKECYIECDNGFLATVRGMDAMELTALHEQEGLITPMFHGGCKKYFQEICDILAKVGIMEDKTAKRCCDCRNGEHDNIDNDVKLTMVREIGVRGFSKRGNLCKAHRTIYEDDGYIVK